jgi:Ca2+-binding EF-hand superfamily protein
MKISKLMIATAVVVLSPMAVFAGDKDKAGSMSTADTRQFATLDTNADGRISANEATSDTKIAFTTADRNKDGYLDSGEYSHRDMPRDAMPNSGDPAKDMPKQ